MKRKVTGLFLALVLILSFCLVAVTPVAADDSDNVNFTHSVSSSCQFEGYLGCPSGISYCTFEGTIEVLDDGTVKGSVNSLYVESVDSFYIVNGVFFTIWQCQEVIEAAIVEVDGKPAVWTLIKAVASGTMLPCGSQFPIDGKYWVALVVDGSNPSSGEDYILGIEGINGETEAKSIYDNYLATGDTSGLSLMDIANCNVVIK